MATGRLPVRISNSVDHYNTLLDRAKNVEIQKLVPINQSIKYAANMYAKAKESRINDEKLVLYYKVVIYITEKLPSHPSWSSVGKEQKQRLKQCTESAFQKAMSLKCEILSSVYRKEEIKKEKSSSVSREKAIGTEFNFFNEAGYTIRNSDGETGGNHPSIPHCSTHSCTINTISESCREDALPDSQTQFISQHSKRVLRTTASSPAIIEGSADAGDRLCPRIQRSVSQPPLATFQVRDYFVENLKTYTAYQENFCPMCAKETQWSFIAQINCTCMIKSNSELQDKQTQTEDVNKLYDAFLLFSETGDYIGTKLLQILTDNGYKICTLQRENVLGKYILGIYTDLIVNSSYVIAVISNELLQDNVNKTLLNRAFHESLCRKYNFLLPIVMDNCDLPEEMKGYGSYKISDNKSPKIDDIVERLLECLPFRPK